MRRRDTQMLNMTWSTDECLLIQQRVKGNPKCEDFVVSKKSENLVW